MPKLAINLIISREIQDKLLSSFYKVFDNLEEVVSYAQKLDYVPSWKTLSQLFLTEQWSEFVAERLR